MNMPMKLALTFDDGPNIQYTQELLAVLAKHGVCASFFMVGRFVEQHPEIAGMVYGAGHNIGNHTFTHPRLTDLSLEDVDKEIRDCNVAIGKIIPSRLLRMFRPPFVLISSAVEEIVLARGLQTIMFKAAAGDGGEPRGVDFMFEKINRELNGESGIILMHDGSHLGVGANRADTVTLTDRLITHYKNKGAEFVFPLEI
jgi:peptidoglycan-N-acetylglucosamine deacetylase